MKRIFFASYLALLALGLLLALAGPAEAQTTPRDGGSKTVGATFATLYQFAPADAGTWQVTIANTGAAAFNACRVQFSADGTTWQESPWLTTAAATAWCGALAGGVNVARVFSLGSGYHRFQATVAAGSTTARFRAALYSNPTLAPPEGRTAGTVAISSLPAITGSVTIPAVTGTVSAEVTKVGGNAIDVGAGNSGTGTQRVVLAGKATAVCGEVTVLDSADTEVVAALAGHTNFTIQVKYAETKGPIQCGMGAASAGGPYLLPSPDATHVGGAWSEKDYAGAVNCKSYDAGAAHVVVEACAW